MSLASRKRRKARRASMNSVSPENMKAVLIAMAETAKSIPPLPEVEAEAPKRRTRTAVR